MDRQESSWAGPGGDWVNSPPLSLEGLRGKVVLLEFWTFGCYNCRNSLAYLRKWDKKYAGSRFEVIGVQMPEYERERSLKNVKRELARFEIDSPVVTVNEYLTWNSYSQQCCSVIYLLDKWGIIRYAHIGEGNNEETERQIACLIGEK